jgi:hypothetical protein
LKRLVRIVRLQLLLCRFHSPEQVEFLARCVHAFDSVTDQPLPEATALGGLVIQVGLVMRYLLLYISSYCWLLMGSHCLFQVGWSMVNVVPSNNCRCIIQ